MTGPTAKSIQSSSTVQQDIQVKDDNDEKDGDGKKKKKKKEPSVPIYKLFRFATPLELIGILISMVLSIGVGAMQPVVIIIFGGMIQWNYDFEGASFTDVTHDLILIFVYMGTATLIAAYISQSTFIMTGESQARRIRELYVHSILRQDMGWFDKAEEGSLTTRLAADTQLIEDGISEKFGAFLHSLGAFITGFIVAFVKGWRLAVVILATMPILAVLGAAIGYFITKFTSRVQDSYAGAGTIAEQAFSGIRTVYSFSLQERFDKMYAEKLVAARKVGVQRALVLGLGFAVCMLVLFATYGLAFWYGGKLVSESKMTGDLVLVVFFAEVIGAMSLMQLPSNLSAVSTACGAAYKIYATIDRVPEIDIDNEGGIKPEKVIGEIEFKNVQFKYPTRPDVTILKNLSLKITPGMTVAFVGPSGSGKSTSVQLIQRFYDPLAGQVTLDGHDLKYLNVKWLRKQIGVVSQEPVLFNMTIRQNLLMGIDYEASREEIIEACKKANCHTFISQLPQAYDTLVGEHGGMLSGGQKQRIAIARAILKNPTILLLDEATSALDTQSERLVQRALDAAAADRTTLVIAHRLSTIRNADLIVVMDKGDLVEQGTHDELLALGGVYSELVKKQQIATKQVGGTDDDEDIDEEAVMQKETEELLKQQQRIEELAAAEKDNKSDHLVRMSTVSSVDAFELKLRKQKEEQKQHKKQKAPIGKILHQMRPEWHLLAIGTVSAAIAGAVFPCFSLIFARVVSVMILLPPDQVAPAPMQGANLYAFIFVMLGVASFIGFGGQLISFELAGERYTERLRAEIFRAYMKQEIGYYDDEENSMGALTSKLAIDSKNVNELVTKCWGDIMQIISTAITGLVISFVHSWLLTLIVLCMSPFIGGATYYESTIHRGFEDKTAKANEQSGEVAGEAIKEVRTVAALNKQGHFEQKFNHALEYPHKLAVKKAYLSSIGYALQQGISMYTNAVAFYAGVRLIDQQRLDFEQMMVCMMAILITAQGIGRASVFTSTYAKAKHSAIAAFEVLDRKSKIDPELEGIEPASSNIHGDIQFKDITFRYPARPDIPIFDGEFNLEGKSGQTIALVGPSGCGKSTTIGMLQRWYDPIDGTVRLDEHNIQKFTLGNLRKHMALVQQEPVLFDMTIGENIRFGVDESKQVTQEEVEAACKAANIHKFISELPDGYNTRVGDKGSQLSGGQKQRIAIARALIRKPRVLLLDEATSALDSESEKLVQQAIDNIIGEGGRTTITIAHRLSTIQQADLICVVKGGRVVEQGTHWELLKLDGEYASLVRQQSLNAH
ncbi:p-glycoprotein [Lichtheimia hyalospora FSU 10163]|nr:p-glycoprotein [Lichtheimia hyalospora FSU 10163]